MPCDTRFGSNGYGPNTCWRVANGSNGLSLSQISTVGARFPGWPMHGKLRAPRTEIGESCGNLQYSPSGVSIIVVSAGLRHCEGGRKPTVHGGGSPRVRVKSPDARPVGLFCGKPNACCAAMYPGNSNRVCSNDGL